ncbi:MAG TPA: LysR family transcriptional regulator [Galbitalea sp.]
MDIDRLNLLSEFAQRGSITAVARATHQTVSGVSQQLRRLEGEAGLPLTEKVGRGLVLTDAGHALAATASELAVALAHAEAEWDAFRNTPTGTVTLVTFPTGGQMFLPGLLARVDAIDELTLECSDQDPAADGFAPLTADFDIVLAHGMQLPRSNATTIVVPVMVEPLDIALSRSHRLADRDYLVPEDLVGERWIGNPWGYPFESWLNTISPTPEDQINVVQRFADTHIIEALVAAGTGIAGLPRYTASSSYPGRIVLKQLRGTENHRNIFILMRRDRAERLAVRKVVELVRAEARTITQT